MLSRHLHHCRCPGPSTLLPTSRAYSSSKGHNSAIVEHLKQHLQEENQRHDRNVYKIRAFASAIKVIDRLDHPIRSTTEARALRGVGDGILKRIEAFVSNPDHHTPGEEISEPPALELARKQAISTLQLVRGIGPRTAQQLVDAGCTSIADLHKPRYNAMLTAAMRKGLRFLNHINEPVSHEEAESVLKFIGEHISSKFEILLTGSFRRGASSSPGIDIALFHPSHVHIPTPPLPTSNSSLVLSSTNKKSPRKRNPTPFRESSMHTGSNGNSSPPHFLQDVVRSLEDRGLLATTFSFGFRHWQGLVRLPERTQDGQWEEKSRRLAQIQRTEGVYRRMEINLIPVKSRGAALLALTGDAEFTKHIHGKAHALGLLLNEFGLWRWRTDGEEDDRSSSVNPYEDDDGQMREIRGYWELMKAESEGEILSELGMEYVEPERRNFGFLVNKNGRRKRSPMTR